MKIQLQDGQITTFEEELGRNAFRHTASHILAQAVKRLYPQTKLAIGPAIADGFYYDFDTEAPLTWLSFIFAITKNFRPKVTRTLGNNKARA